MNAPEFDWRRGKNDKRVNYLRQPELIVDTLDVGLFGQLDQLETVSDSPRSYTSNEALWYDVLRYKLFHGERISLKHFCLLEWLPSSPGRYFTEEAAEAREEATRYIDSSRDEYLPLGKSEMVLGGVGSVRLAPRIVRGRDVCFMCASSNGVSHQGIPIVAPIDLGRELLRKIQQHGAALADVVGTLWPLPIFESPVKFDRGIPKYFLFVDSIGAYNELPRGALVTVAITYNSTYEGSCDVVSGIPINPKKNWSFASFNPLAGKPVLIEAVKWLRDYAMRHSSFGHGVDDTESLSIVGDFDEAISHFPNPIEFPLSSLLNGRVNPAILAYYGQHLNLTITNKLVMGDNFENIQHSTIINRSTLNNALNQIRRSSGSDVADALKQIADAVENSGNAAAKATFDKLSEELSKPAPEKSRLKQLWESLSSNLPSIATLTEASVKIAGLFS